jgi:hypothetical protein
MNGWGGHRRATSEALFAVLLKAAGGGEFSRAERVLFTACEFWAAVNNRSLRQHLSDSAIARLQDAEESFETIGLVSVAALLRSGRISLTGASPPVPLRRVAATIEETLTRTAEPVDELIADFAREQTWERLPRS